MSDRLQKAENYIRTARSVYDHYSMEGVRDSVQQGAGIPDFTVGEAIELVNKVRASVGWSGVMQEDIVSGESESNTVFCLRCQITHDGGQC